VSSIAQGHQKERHTPLPPGFQFGFRVGVVVCFKQQVEAELIMGLGCCGFLIYFLKKLFYFAGFVFVPLLILILILDLSFVLI